MAITQIIATLPAVLNDSETFYEDIAVRNNSLVTVSFPSINTWATQANTTQSEINAKAAQVAAQAVDGGYSQDYINDNFYSQDYINDNFVNQDINSLTNKTTPVDADEMVLADSTSSFSLKKLSLSNLKATLKTYFDNLYNNFVANDSRVKTALNASGTAPIYACRAWVNFNGTGTVAIRESGNVSSITDLGTGVYRKNFITAMSDSNYSTVASAQASGTGFQTVTTINSISTTYVEIRTLQSSDGTAIDSSGIFVHIFR